MEAMKTPRSRGPQNKLAKMVSDAVGTAIGSIRARYDAAGTGKRLAGWNPPSTGPNKAVYGLQKIRDRSRDAVRNDWTGESGIQKWTTNLIGIGIVPRLKRIKDKKRKQVLQDLWDDWVQVCDADGVLNFYGLQTLAVRSWLEAGEVFIRKRPRMPDASLPVPLQVQLIEAEFVPMLDANTYPGMPVGNTIRSGIERDKRGQRVAYWMYREHPGDGYGGVINPANLLRIPASEVLHMFEPKRAGQLRGVSMLAPTLTKLRDLGNYQDAVLLRQQIANLFVAFLKRTVPPADANADPLTGKAIEGNYDNPLMPLAPGLIQELDDGQEVQFGNPPEAGTTYSDYIRTELMGLAASNGLPYELFSGDIKQVSDRTLRVIINDFRRFAEQRQWQVVIPMLCQPVREWFCVAATANGTLQVSEFDDAKRVEWAPHGWAYIHPVQDPQGKQMEVSAGFRSRSSVIGERGDDPEAVDQERADDQAREQELGIYSDPSGKTDPHGDPIEQDGIAPGEYSAPPNVAPKKGKK
jgi:lambda family phage portal protein